MAYTRTEGSAIAVPSPRPAAMFKLFFNWPAWAIAVIYLHRSRPVFLPGNRLVEVRDAQGRRTGAWDHAGRKGWLRVA